MAKKQYRFNPKSLQMEEVEITTKDRLKKLSGSLITGIVFSAIFLWVAYFYFPSPREKSLIRENKQYELQLKIMNDRLSQMDRVLLDIQQRDDNVYRSIFAAEPVPAAQRQAGYGGTDRYAQYQGYKSADLLTETAKKLDRISRQLYVQSKSFDEVFELARKKEEMLHCIPAIQPINNKELKRIASGFGMRIHPVYKTRKMHEGIDFSAPKGTPIYATGDGKVEFSKRRAGYGKLVVINHGYGYQTYYGHMNKIIVRRYQKVKRGQIIGYVGNTGVSTGPHLHYEVRYKKRPVNPVHYFFNDLTPEEYEKVIEIASRPTQALS